MFRSFILLGLLVLLTEAKLKSRAQRRNIIENKGSRTDYRDESKVVYTVVLFRHGDRPPSIPFPNGPNNNNPMYVRGFGQLLPQGEKRHYKLGRYFAERYIENYGLLSARYTPEEFYARSLDMDRVMCSGLSNLAGLYKPTTEYDIWNEDLLWQAVPLHTVEMGVDTLMSPKFPCPNYDELYLETVSSDGAVAIQAAHQSLLDKVNKNAGKKYDWNTFYIFSDAIWTDQFFGLPKPDWLSAEEVQRISDFYLYQLGWWFEKPEMRKFRIGTVLTHVAKVFYAAATGSNFPSGAGRKATWLSGQAETVAPLLYTFGVFNNQWPGFASAVMMELHKNEHDEHFHVQIYYKNETDHEAYFMDMPACKYPCSLTNFLNMIAPYEVKDLAEECEIQPEEIAKRKK